MSDLWDLIVNIGILDMLDIAFVSGVFFSLFLLLRESRSRVALEGLLTVLLLSFFIYFIAKFFSLTALKLIFERFWIIVVLAVLIVFQNEFKKALIDLGQLRILRVLFKHSGEHLEEIIAAAQVMSKQHIGALIAMERRNPLKAYADTGAAIDSVVASEVLRTIFTPRSPLHDGAAIVRNERLVAAACILPLTSNMSLPKETGTRHRAALGLSEETDALVLVVSEETGAISIASGGHLRKNISIDDLRRSLLEEFNVPEENETEEDVD